MGLSIIFHSIIFVFLNRLSALNGSYFYKCCGAKMDILFQQSFLDDAFSFFLILPPTVAS